MPNTEVKYCLTTYGLNYSIPKTGKKEGTGNVTELEFCRLLHQSIIEHKVYCSPRTGNPIAGLSTIVHVPTAELMIDGQMPTNWVDVFNTKAGAFATIIFREYLSGK